MPAQRPARRALAMDALSQDTKSRILDAAESLFTEHGFEATSLRQPHVGRRREPRGGELPLRDEGRALPGGAHAPARPDEPGAHRPPRALRARGGRPPAHLREDPLGDAHPGAQALAATRSAAGKDFLRVLGRAYADPAPFIRNFLSAQYAEMIARFKEAFLAGAAAPHEAGAHVAPAFRHGRALVHARGHRRAQAHGAGDPAATRTTTRCCCSASRRSSRPASRRRWATRRSSSWSRATRRSTPPGQDE